MTPADNHEPLPTAWAFNYLITGGVSTQVAVWKNYDDFGYDTNDDPVVEACRPYIYYAFDESENSRASTSQTCPSGTYCLQPEPNVFPFQTQKVTVNKTNFDGLMDTNGWMLLVFDPTIYGPDDDVRRPVPPDLRVRQVQLPRLLHGGRGDRDVERVVAGSLTRCCRTSTPTTAPTPYTSKPNIRCTYGRASARPSSFVRRRTRRNWTSPSACPMMIGRRLTHAQNPFGCQ